MADRLAQLMRLRESDPRDPFLTYGIALEHVKLGQTADALHCLDQTLALDSNYCYAYFQKGKLLLNGGDESEARRILQDGLNAAQRAGDQHARGEIAELLASIES